MDKTQFYTAMQQWYIESYAYDLKQADRLQRWRNLEPESAQFICQLMWMIKPQQVLELGTSNGYSTAWFAFTLKQMNLHLTTVEIEAERSQLAQQKLKMFAVDDVVRFIVADAGHYLQQAQQAYELIFLDAERCFYMDYIDDLKILLRHRVGNTLVVDNVISHANDVSEFLNQFKQDTAFICQTLALGAGLFIVTYIGE